MIVFLAIAAMGVLILLVVVAYNSVLEKSPEARALHNEAKSTAGDFMHEVRTAKLRRDIDRIDREGR